MIRTSFVERNLRHIFPLPAVIFVVLMTIFPIVYTLVLSFSNWNLTSGNPFEITGVRAYERIVGEPRFLEAIGRTFGFTGLAILAETVMGVIIALILNRNFRGKGVVKMFMLLPLVATPVAIGIVWNLFYDPNIGLVNFVLTSFGLPPGEWVYAGDSVLVSLVIVDVWQWTPMIAIIVLAGLAGLSTEPYESARVDGANEAQILFRITLPMLLPTILTAMILRSIDALKTFDIIYAMTGGGPGYASETLNIMAFKYSFEYFRMGQSAVILVALFAVVLLFSLLIMKLRKVSEQT